MSIDYDEYISLLPNVVRCAYWLRSSVREQFAVTTSISRGADLIVGSMFQLAAPSIAEANRIPYVYAAYSPSILKSRREPMPGVPFQGLPPWTHLLLRCIRNGFGNVVLREAINLYRSELTLRPITSMFDYIVHSGFLIGAFDHALFGNLLHLSAVPITGSWRLSDQSLPLQEEIVRFLNDGPPPWYIGFGSATKMKEDAIASEIQRALGMSGHQRTIIHTGISHQIPTRISKNCLVVGSVSHAKLLPQMNCVIHHGGIGTTVAAAAAGVPQITIPHFGDQFYTATRIHKLGLGPAPVSRGVFSAYRIKSAIDDVLANKGYKSRAKEFRHELPVSTDGVRQASEVIESLLAKASRI